MVVERLLGGFGIIDLHVRVAIHNSVGLSILTQRNLTEVWGGICFISAFPPPPGLNVAGLVCFFVQPWLWTVSVNIEIGGRVGNALEEPHLSFAGCWMHARPPKTQLQG